MKNGKVQIGIVGCGGIANQKHMPAMKANADLCDIIAFCDLKVYNHTFVEIPREVDFFFFP